jgi:hypothetical protein
MIVLGFTATAAWAQTQAGVIKTARVSGTVTIIAADGSQHAAAEGATIAETDTVVTGANSGVVLVFMNGSSVKLAPNSRLLVEEFKMDPLDTNITVSKLTKEPSVSQTKLNLAYGDMVGDVKKLNKSSTYGIKTPVGAAGIRGTTFRIVFTLNANGTAASFSLQTSEGLVVFTGSNGASTQVGAGTQVTVTAEVNTATGAVTSSSVTSGNISAADNAAIQAAVDNVIKQAQEQSVFTPAEQTSGSGNAAGADGPAKTTDEVPAGVLVQPVTPTVVSPSS